MGSDRLLWIEIRNEHPRFVYRAGGQFDRLATHAQTEEHQVQRDVDVGYALARRWVRKSGEPQHLAFGASPTAARMVTMARKRSRSLSPGKFGYSTFAYPVRYSYKRDARTSLFQPYHSSLLSRILSLLQKSEIRLM
jgi:hypothetical protein